MKKLKCKIDHISIHAKNIEATVKWFQEAFFFSQILSPGIVEMKASGIKGKRCCIENENHDIIEIIEKENQSNIQYGSQSTISHFAMQVNNLEELRNHLLSRNFIDKKTQIMDIKVVKIMYFSGIDNVEIELIEKCI